MDIFCFLFLFHAKSSQNDFQNIWNIKKESKKSYNQAQKLNLKITLCSNNKITSFLLIKWTPYYLWE